ncbi:hypothetical protein ACIP5Y_07150 [Nocardia sp. NPDC088792]|uniref:hypothetical protein n=1 Tax=Nocardia sp. NPDC088792 TaxID=3364332 RepID=UPI0037F4B982
MIETLSRGDYEQQRHFGAAGPVSQLAGKTIDAWRTAEPRWSGKYWLFVRAEDRVWSLHPINVTARDKKK